MMPSKEFMAKKRMGFKIFKRVPYGSRIEWGGSGPEYFSSPEEGFNVLLPKRYGHGSNGLTGPWNHSSNGNDVRDWFDAAEPWSGIPKFKTLKGKPI